MRGLLRCNTLTGTLGGVCQHSMLDGSSAIHSSLNSELLWSLFLLVIVIPFQVRFCLSVPLPFCAGSLPGFKRTAQLVFVFDIMKAGLWLMVFCLSWTTTLKSVRVGSSEQERDQQH